MKVILLGVCIILFVAGCNTAPVAPDPNVNGSGLLLKDARQKGVGGRIAMTMKQMIKDILEIFRVGDASIDLLWRAKLILEHKSRGASLEQAETEAFGYIERLSPRNHAA
jgi:hypothetical protein